MWYVILKTPGLRVTILSPCSIYSSTLHCHTFSLSTPQCDTLHVGDGGREGDGSHTSGEQMFSAHTDLVELRRDDSLIRLNWRMSLLSCIQTSVFCLIALSLAFSLISRMSGGKTHYLRAALERGRKISLPGRRTPNHSQQKLPSSDYSGVKMLS